MASDYWQLYAQALSQNYQTELLPILNREEGNQPAYLDTKGNASIGIGVNITLPQNLALVLQTLGVINASQTMARQQVIVNKFEDDIRKSTI